MGGVKMAKSAGGVLKIRKAAPAELQLAAPNATPTLTDEEAAVLESTADAESSIARAETLKESGRIAAGLALLRNAWKFARSRAEQVALTERASALDEEFGRLIAEADSARDVGDPGRAEKAYERALHLYPMHAGYRIQYAHALKDQERFLEAEVHYRTALALGAPAADVHRHLLFCAGRQGYDAPPPAARPWRGGMLDPPTHFDIDTLGYLTLREDRLSDERRLELLRLCATCEDVIVRLIREESFAARNGQFLEVLRAQP